MLFAHPLLVLLPERVHLCDLVGRHGPDNVDAGAVFEHVEGGHVGRRRRRKSVKYTAVNKSNVPIFRRMFANFSGIFCLV